MDEEQTFVFVAPEIEKPELRLYYDDNGKVVCYSCEKLDGNYIIIDTQTYAECRHDIRIVDGKIIKLNESSYIARLYPTEDNTGMVCEKEDISIVTQSEGQYWKLVERYFKL